MFPSSSRRATLTLCAALLAAWLAGSLAGCSLAPKYERPAAPVPLAFPQSTPEGQRGVAMSVWREFFKDPVICQLVELGLANNRDLRMALLNIERTRAMFRVQVADVLPTIGANASSDSQRMPADFQNIPPGLPIKPQAFIQRQYTVNLGFSAFELDLFGRIQSLSLAALETYYSAEMDARSAQISLVSEIAGLYLQLVADRELVDITKATYKNRRGQFELVSNKFRSGVASQLEVSQAKSIMEEARSNVSRYETQAGQAENYLSLLLGAPLPKDLPNVRRLRDVMTMNDVPEGLSSALLERRPDIQAAEHQLKSANYNIGAARANFFPTISLTGALGTISVDASNLFTSGQGFWRFAPQVSVPIFDTGRNIANLQGSEASKNIAVANYEKTVQVAFREVADALVQRAFIGDQLDAELSLLRSTQEGYNLASARYDVGIDSYLNVLDAQRSLYNAQQSYINTKLLRESNAIALFKALGGGWR